MGGKGSAPSIGPSPLAKEQAAFLKQQRKGVIEPAQAALLPGMMAGAPQALSTSLDPRSRATLEAQANQARQNIMQSGVRGGLMQKMLGTADIARAESVANAANQARNLGSLRSLQLLGPAAFPGAGQVMQAGQAAAQSDEQRRLQNAQMASQAGGGKGEGMMGLMSLGKMFMG
jgi:hypothetical protein